MNSSNAAHSKWIVKDLSNLKTQEANFKVLLWFRF